MTFQYLAFLLLLGHVWQSNPDNLPFKVPEMDVKIFSSLVIALMLAPSMRLILLLSFTYHWLAGNYRQEVGLSKM